VQQEQRALQETLEVKAPKGSLVIRELQVILEILAL
jgi:hypothetical protein